MDREKLNATVFKHDTNRHITSQAYVTFALPSAHGVDLVGASQPRPSQDSTPNSIPTECSEFELVSDDAYEDAQSIVTDVGGVLIELSRPPSPSYEDAQSTVTDGGGVLIELDRTPSRSSIVTCSEWSHVQPPDLPLSTLLQQSCTDVTSSSAVCCRWSCNQCERTFSSEANLFKHLDSVAHAPKIFHCPNFMPFVTGSKPKQRSFKTLSGLAQHIESGACAGGKQVLKTISAYFEKEIEMKLGAVIKILKSGM